MVRSSMMLCAGCAAVLLSAPQAWEQLPIRYVEGKVLLDGQLVALERLKYHRLTLAYYPPIQYGQVLETANGRVDAGYGPTFGLFLGENSSIRILTATLRDLTFEIQSGRVVVDRSGSKVTITIRYRDAMIVLDKGGQWLIDADSGRICVLSGSATVTYGVALECASAGACRLVVGRQPANTVEVMKGQQVVLNEILPISPFDKNENKTFKRWVDRRLTADRPNTLSPVGFNQSGFNQ